jgi:hypothetical protein
MNIQFSLNIYPIYQKKEVTFTHLGESAPS